MRHGSSLTRVRGLRKRAFVAYPAIDAPRLAREGTIPMRLTLRTLLAWLDDTLSPSEVREIGKQVSESPFAKELVEKIHRVTRQRRLTIPPLKGPDSVDANIVASYLDNELDPDAVAELEKKCLMSDVHLAEVASVHQVLSLIGQKAKVPVEARHRMYQLIKGREAVKPQGSRASRQTEPRPVAEPVQPWITAPLPRQPLWKQYWMPASVVGLMGLLCVTAWNTLSPTDASPQGTRLVASKIKPVPVVPRPAKPDDSDASTNKARAGAASGTTEPGAPTETEKAAAKDTEPVKPADVAPGTIGLAKKSAGVLLRFNPDPLRREWERLTGVTPLREQDRLLSLEPFRSTIEIGTADVDLVSGTEIWARATLPTHAARLTLAQGRVVLHGTSPTLPFEVQFGGKTVKITPPPGSTIAVERINRRAPGEPSAATSVLRVYAADGPVKLATASQEQTLDGTGAVTVEPDGSFTEISTKSPPRWVTDTAPVPYDVERGEQFLKFLPPDRPIMASLVEASEDDQKDVCRLAISALHAVGDISLIVPLLHSRIGASAPIRRKAAINVLREFLAQGPEAGKELHMQLEREFGADLAASIEKLLIGYTPKEASDETTFTKLVQILGTTDPNEIGVRELALDNLMTLTGRDDLGYDPEKPDGKGLKAWRDLLHAHELKSSATAKNAK